jgi:alcohol dehydrogenase class IV
VLFDGALSDAPDYTINEAGALAVREKVDGVVAVGGGSSIDTGKASTSCCQTHPPSTAISRGRASPDGRLTQLKPLIVIRRRPGRAARSRRAAHAPTRQ